MKAADVTRARNNSRLKGLIHYKSAGGAPCRLERCDFNAFTLAGLDKLPPTLLELDGLEGIALGLGPLIASIGAALNSV